MFEFNHDNVIKIDNSDPTKNIIYCKISKERKDKLETNFNDYVLIFKGPPKFKKMVSDYLDKQNIKYYWNEVKYYDPKFLSNERYNTLGNGIDLAFYKIKDKFSY
jgi:hypothetical protein